MATGTPLVGGLIAGLFDGIILYTGVRLVPKIGAPTVIALVVTALSVPTVNFGPPGPYKILVGLVLGLTYDVFLLATRRATWAYIVGMGVTFAASVPATYFIWLRFGIPGNEKLEQIMAGLAGIYFVLGVIGSTVGHLFFERRLKRLARVRALLSESARSDEGL
jgi:ABC-type thiamin/hydroxymethylpyrimidine transport system permease subunit